MNKKGQALVEFVMILPVFLMLVFGMIDFGKILITKYKLQDNLDMIVDLYKNQRNINDYINKNNISLNIEEDSEFITFKVTSKIDISTPGLNLVLGNPYLIEESVVIVNEIK